jgi:hypothetical protein
MENAVQIWFKEGCDFYAGVTLLHEAGGDIQAFAPYLSESFIPSSKREQLKALINGISLNQSKPPFIQSNRPFIQSNPHFTDPRPLKGSAPEHPTITQLREKARMLHKHHADCHAQLQVEPEQEKRYTLIVEIMQTIIPTLDGIYDSIREYKATGALPVDSGQRTVDNYETGLRDGVVKFQRLQNLKSRLSKLDGKSGLIEKEADPVRKKKLQEELADKIKECNTLSLELNLTETHD